MGYAFDTPGGQATARWHPRRRALAVAAGLAAAFLAVGGQLVRLAVTAQGGFSVAMSEPVATSFARPDILDRNGRLLATDVEMPSLFADPALILDRDEAVEKLASVLPDLDEGGVRASLSDRSRRFIWIRRGLSPRAAQAVHNLGIPGLAFRRELRRAYPAGRLAGHVLGSVNVDNKGLSGLERYIDEAVGVEPVHGATLSDRPPVKLSLDLAVQHALEDEIRGSMRRFGARAGAGLVLDIETGEIIASASLPDVDPADLHQAMEPERLDRIAGGAFELGSVFKAFTVAMALDEGHYKPGSLVDVTQPLVAGRYTIKDLHPAGRPLNVAEIFVTSSNVGAGMLALDAGAERQQQFLKRIGLMEGMKTEAGPIASPIVPQSWGRAETITISYGHGLAVAPLQFATAAAALLNGGVAIQPTFLKRRGGVAPERPRVLEAATSTAINDLMRRNVTDSQGTGRRAEAPGYQVGGKTGTAELPGRGGYKESAVIASFLGAFPMPAPRYLTLFMLFEPVGTVETRRQVTAGVNAAPATARLVSRIAPLLGILPITVEADASRVFDDAEDAK